MPNGFVMNAHRLDPYKNFKFRVLWPDKRDGTPVPVLGVSKVSALKRTTEVVNHRSGGENSTDHKSPGRTKYEGVTMERGITHDLEFENWANMVHPYAGDASMDLVNYKKELTLEVMNEKGHVALRYFLHDCWVSEFTAVPDLDANANAVAIESIKIELEGWERDPSTAEPIEAQPVTTSGTS
jgi:phage tail-like protein